mmetsp:Transcript_351/g.1159  ORF Transcript_351/g.1159 Transcript_351/m.1159 type:complete len:340 (-) Transcript_351:57-1076(-)
MVRCHRRRRGHPRAEEDEEAEAASLQARAASSTTAKPLGSRPRATPTTSPCPRAAAATMERRRTRSTFRTPIFTKRGCSRSSSLSRVVASVGAPRPCPCPWLWEPAAVLVLAVLLLPRLQAAKSQALEREPQGSAPRAARDSHPCRRATAPSPQQPTPLRAWQYLREVRKRLWEAPCDRSTRGLRKACRSRTPLLPQKARVPASAPPRSRRPRPWLRTGRAVSPPSPATTATRRRRARAGGSACAPRPRSGSPSRAPSDATPPRSHPSSNRRRRRRRPHGRGRRRVRRGRLRRGRRRRSATLRACQRCPSRARDDSSSATPSASDGSEGTMIAYGLVYM